MTIQHLAAFSHHGQGGNPAGVLISEKSPKNDEMLNIAKKLGYSETAFLQPEYSESDNVNQQKNRWRIRYFSPELEVPFCGHATVASGAALAENFGVGDYQLISGVGDINIKVTANAQGNFVTRFCSTNTHSKPADTKLVQQVIELFNVELTDISPQFPIHLAYAGANHLILVLKEKQMLDNIDYQFEPLKSLLLAHDILTVNLLWQESSTMFHARNPFPVGGIYEDPATGAAAAAFAGYLRDIDKDQEKNITILQGHHMKVSCYLHVEITEQQGAGILVSGESRKIQ